MYQLDLFRPNETENDKLWNEIDFVKSIANDTAKTCDNVRKGMFKRHCELAKLYMKLLDRVEENERKIAMLERMIK